MIAALYVAEEGIYARLPGVDVWPLRRDARLYKGPWPVVAHPPCQNWGKLAQLAKRDQKDCAPRAVQQVRENGGVLEHPQHSALWAEFGFNKPPASGGWVNADFRGGWTCRVDQGLYGHEAAKPTWLLYYGPPPPPLRWGVASGLRSVESLPSGARREATPEPFARTLLGLAQLAERVS